MAASTALKPRSAFLESDTGRTRVSVSLDGEGGGRVVIVQDGHTWSEFDIPRELRGPNGEPRNTN